MSAVRARHRVPVFERSSNGRTTDFESVYRGSSPCLSTILEQGEILMYRMREWSMRHARVLNHIYNLLERFLVLINPILLRIKYKRIQPVFVVSEKVIKGFLFDCKMCGQCVLSSTGMVCPMNCPKELRNGPCGGVLQNGNCEVIPDMKCVWVLAHEGATKLPDGIEKMREISVPIDFTKKGQSAWLNKLETITNNVGKR